MVAIVIVVVRGRPGGEIGMDRGTAVEIGVLIYPGGVSRGVDAKTLVLQSGLRRLDVLRRHREAML